jgi:hypothetical protein
MGSPQAWQRDGSSATFVSFTLRKTRDFREPTWPGGHRLSRVPVAMASPYRGGRRPGRRDPCGYRASRLGEEPHVTRGNVRGWPRHLPVPVDRLPRRRGRGCRRGFVLCVSCSSCARLGSCLGGRVHRGRAGRCGRTRTGRHRVALRRRCRSVSSPRRRGVRRVRSCRFGVGSRAPGTAPRETAGRRRCTPSASCVRATGGNA